MAPILKWEFKGIYKINCAPRVPKPMEGFPPTWKKEKKKKFKGNQKFPQLLRKPPIKGLIGVGTGR